MAKRPFSQYSNDLPVSLNDALNDLRDNADDIISFLQDLKREKHDASRETQQHLSRLRTRLAPSFKVFAEAGIKTPTPSENQLRAPGHSRHEAHNPAPWTVADIGREYPPLPEVHDTKLRDTAFRHPGRASAANPSYELLEWQGDAFLEYVATNLILNTFTRLSPGRRSQVRESLIRNVQLAEYFRAYGMQKHANIPDDIKENLARGRSADKDMIKVQADMFESYVAAVLQSRGPAVATAWLRCLWAKTLAEDIKKLNDTTTEDTPSHSKPSYTTAKDRLSVLIGAKGVRLQYKDLPESGIKKDKKLNLPLFVIGVYLTGWGEQNKLLGIGSALSKSEAGMKAAQRALENEKLLKVYLQKKEKFTEARAAAAAAAAEAGGASTANTTTPTVTSGNSNSTTPY